MIIELRISESDKKWEDTPTIKKSVKDHSEANDEARKLANSSNREVRWNMFGLLQGHYFRPNII